MFDITPYSILWVNGTASVYLIIYMLIAGNKKLISKIPFWMTVLFTVIIGIRLLLPVEYLNISHTFISYELLPPIHEAVYKNVSNNLYNISYLSLIYIIWAIISLILLIRYFISYYRLYKIIKFTPQIDNRCFEISNNLKKENDYKFNYKYFKYNILVESHFIFI